MEKIYIEFLPKYEEYLEAWELYYKNSVLRKADIFADILGFCCGVFVIIISIFWEFYILPFIIGIFSIIFSVLHFLKIRNFTNLFTKIQFQNNKKFSEIQKLSFDEKWIDYITKWVKSRIEWNFYLRYLVSKNVILLIYGKNQFSIIPKSAFSPWDLEKFSELLFRNFYR